MQKKKKTIGLNFSLNERDLFLYYQKEGLSKHQFATDFKSWFHRMRYKVSMNYISIYGRNAVILDVGCAEGWITKWASQDAEFVVGLEISKAKLKRAVLESKKENNDFVLGSWDYLPFRKNVFDLVVWLEGPEHAIHPDKVIGAIHNILKFKGFLIISTMGLLPPLHYQLMYKILCRWEKYLNHMHMWGHVSLFTRKSLLEILNTNKFSLIKEIFIGPRFITIYGIACKLANLLHIRTNFFPLPWPGLGCVIYITLKVS